MIGTLVDGLDNDAAQSLYISHVDYHQSSVLIFLALRHQNP